MEHYMLINRVVVPTQNLMEWAEWFQENQDRHVAETRIGNIRVSTVFLGIERPWLFETMIFGGELNLWQRRSGTWEEAEQTHAEALHELKILASN